MNARKLSKITERKFIESYSANGKSILTPNGMVKILEVHKTIKYRKFRISTENGFVLNCAFNHVLIKSDGTEIYAKDSLGHELNTIYGNSEVVGCLDLNIEEHMFDLTLDSKEEVYYSDGILSHNSGKSVSTAMYLAHLYNFGKEKNIGIVGNKGAQAREFLNNTKNIIMALPLWMQQGTTVWNKGSIENESGMRILTDVPNSDSFRGWSIHCLDAKSKIKVYDKIDKIFKEITMKELFETC